MIKATISFFFRQYNTIRQGGWTKLFSVLSRTLQFVVGSIPAIIFLVFMRSLRHWYLIRINRLIGLRIGHMAANTEIYLCEIDAGINVPDQNYLDIAFFGGTRISNRQLAKMWRRTIRIWPKWFMEPLFYLNRLIPGGAVHETENEKSDFQYGRDIKGLMASSEPHLKFTQDEEQCGQAGLRALGIPENKEFICLIVRDSAYLNKVLPDPNNWNYHSYRDSDIQSYVSTAEALADLGYNVIRMGEIVKQPMNSVNPKVIDYATNGLRSDFMDIYLGANCLFCITVGTGYDAVPMIFRRPMVFVNAVPLGFLSSFIKNCVCINKKHWKISENRFLTLREILNSGAAYGLYSYDFELLGVRLIDNTSEEIKSVVMELLMRIKGDWRPESEDELLQTFFWDVVKNDRNENIIRPLHQNINAHYGAQFLRDNRSWLDD